MPTLSTEHKVFVVTMLARWNTPTEVVELVQEEFGLELDRRQVDYYNPTTSQKPADRWVELFHEARRRYTSSVEEVAIAHERVRLETLQKIVEDRMDRMDHRTVMEALAQAAKERGQKYTNVTDVQSKGERMEAPEIYVYGGDPEEQEDDG